MRLTMYLRSKEAAVRRAHAGRVSLAAAAAGAVIAAGLAAASASTTAPRALAAAQAAAPDTITTVAGGVGGPGPATSVALLSPCGLRYTGGALYVGTDNAVRRINPVTDGLTNVAGDNATSDVSGSAPATGDAIAGACNLAADSRGNFLVPLGTGVDVIAALTGTFYGKRMTAGHLYQIADFGSQGNVVDVEPGAGGSLLATVNGQPQSHGNAPLGAHIYVIAERTGSFYGQKMTGGHTYTIAGTTLRTSSPFDGVVATKAWLGSYLGNFRVDHAGNLVFAEPVALPGGVSLGETGSLVRVLAEKTATFYGQKMERGHIYNIAGEWRLPALGGNGVPATKAGLYAPSALAFDSSGNVLIADWGQVRVVAVRNGTFYGRAMKSGYIYTIAGTSEPATTKSPVYSGDGGPALKAVFATVAIAADGNGNVLLTSNTGRVLMIAEKTGTFYAKKMYAQHIYSIAGYVYLLAGYPTRGSSGDGGAATSAELHPVGVAYDRVDGLTLIPDIGVSGIRAVASRTGTYFGQKMTAGDIYAIAGAKDLTPRSGVPGRDAGFDLYPRMQLAVTAAGNVVAAQNQFNVAQVLADKSGTFYGQRMKAGYVYTIAGTGTAGYSGDKGPAVKAELNDAGSAAVDGNGNILLADGPRVRVIAAKTGTFYGVAMTAGDIYTIAGDGSETYSGDGGPATAAGMAPRELTVDKTGNVLISDSFNSRIRVLAARSGTFYGAAMTAGDIYTIAGGGSATTANGVPATTASIYAGETAIDPAGNVVLDDGSAVRVVAVRTGAFYGQKMTAGDIYTIGGTSSGTQTFGDGGPATKAFLNIDGLAVTPAGDVLIADVLNSRIRSIAG